MSCAGRQPELNAADSGQRIGAAHRFNIGIREIVEAENSAVTAFERLYSSAEIITVRSRPLRVTMTARVKATCF